MKCRYAVLILFPIFFFPFVCLRAQDSSFHLKPVQQITTDEGLSNNMVYGILQDKKGFMWFLTYTGLDRYDGHTFKTYRYSPEHTDYIRPGFFTPMTQDSSGIIWINNSIAGVYSFNPVTEKFIFYNHIPSDTNSLSDDQNFGTVAGRNDVVWIPTYKGLDKLDTRSQKFSHFKHRNGDSTTISNDFVISACSDEDGNLWIATASPGIDYFNPATGKVMKHFDYGTKKAMTIDANSGIYGVTRGRNGNIWINSRDNGIMCYNTRTKKITEHLHPQQLPFANAGNGLLYVFEDSRNNLWAASGNGGIDFYDRAQEKFFHCNSFGSESFLGLTSFCEDKSGALWFGTDKGVFITDTKTKKFQSYQHDPADKNSLCDNGVFSFLRDSRGVLYVGSTGVDIANPNYEKFNHLHLMVKGKNIFENNNYVWQIREDSKKNIWFSTINGLACYNPVTKETKWYQYNPLDSSTVSAQSVTGILEDRKGRFWCTTAGGGFNSFNPESGTFHSFKKNESENFSSSTVVNLFEDSRGTIYMGSWNVGMITFNPDSETFRIYRHDDKNIFSISDDIVNDFEESKNGYIWVSTMAGGINVFDPRTKKFRTFSASDGLISNLVMSIVEDNNGNYWLGTDNGITCFTPPENPFDEKIKIRFRNYTQSDGLPSRETDGFNAFKDKDGTLFFGTKNDGFFSFHPEELTDNSFIPPVYITGFKLFNKSVEPNAQDSILKLPIELTKEIILTYNQNVIAFEFAVLNFFHPERNQYAYMLEGYDKDWIYTDASKPFANYTNLDPREYIFKVKGSNNDGVWNDIPATIKLIITPPFWQTWWFRILLVLAVAAVAYGYYRNRINQILLLQKIRNKIAADLHDDIGSTLNSISVYSEVAKKDPSQQNFALDMIGESSRKVIESMSDIVWSINPENDGFDKIILRMRSLSYNLMKAKKIEFTFRTDETLHEIKLPIL
jgi:ligand-binding sensor domain-containing protein